MIIPDGLKTLKSVQNNKTKKIKTKTSKPKQICVMLVAIVVF